MSSMLMRTIFGCCPIDTADRTCIATIAASTQHRCHMLRIIRLKCMKSGCQSLPVASHENAPVIVDGGGISTASSLAASKQYQANDGTENYQRGCWLRNLRTRKAAAAPPPG